MNELRIQRPTPRPQPVGKDKRCRTCGNVNRNALPGDTCVWGSSYESELRTDQNAQCGGELVSL